MKTLEIHQILVTQRRRGQGVDPEANGMQMAAASTDLNALGIDPEYFIFMGKHYGEILHGGAEEWIVEALAAEEAYLEGRPEEEAVGDDVISQFPVIWCHERVGKNLFATTRIGYVGRTPPPDLRLGNFILQSFIYPIEALTPCKGNPLALIRSKFPDGRGLFYFRDPGLNPETPWITKLPVIAEFPETDSAGTGYFHQTDTADWAGPLSEQLRINLIPTNKEQVRAILLCVPDPLSGISAVESLLNYLPPSIRAQTTFTTYESYLTNQKIGIKGWDAISANGEENRHVISALAGSNPDFKLREGDFSEKFVVNFLSKGRSSEAPALSAFSEFVANSAQSGRYPHFEAWLDYIEDSDKGASPANWPTLERIASSLDPDLPIDNLKAVIMGNAERVNGEQSGALVLAFLRKLSSSDLPEDEKNGVILEAKPALIALIKKAILTGLVDRIQQAVAGSSIKMFEAQNPIGSLCFVSILRVASLPIGSLLRSLMKREISQEFDSAPEIASARLELIGLALNEELEPGLDKLDLVRNAVFHGRNAGEQETACDLVLPWMRRRRGSLPSSDFFDQFEPEEMEPENCDTKEFYVFLTTHKLSQNTASAEAQEIIENDIAGFYSESNLSPDRSGEDIFFAITTLWPNKFDQAVILARMVDRWITNHHEDPMNFFFEKFHGLIVEDPLSQNIHQLHKTLLKDRTFKVLAREILTRRSNAADDHWEQWLNFYNEGILAEEPVLKALIKRISIVLEDEPKNSRFYHLAKNLISRDLPDSLVDPVERLKGVILESSVWQIPFGPVIPSSGNGQLLNEINASNLKDPIVRERIDAISLMTRANLFIRRGDGPPGVATFCAVHQRLVDRVKNCTHEEQATANRFLEGYVEECGIQIPADARSFLHLHRSLDTAAITGKIAGMLLKRDLTTRMITIGCFVVAAYHSDQRDRKKLLIVASGLITKLKRNEREMLEQFLLHRFGNLKENGEYQKLVKDSCSSPKR